MDMLLEQVEEKLRNVPKAGEYLAEVPRMIALLKEFWGLGIGTAMFREMITLAKQWCLMQLELEVIEGNKRAMALYQKMGFQITGFTPDAIRLPDGKLVKEFIMVKKL